MIEIVRTIQDEEMVANGCKCIRITCRDDQNIDVLVKKRKDIGNVLVETLNMHAYSDAISQEILSVSYLADLKISNLGVKKLHKKDRVHHPHFLREPKGCHWGGQDHQE